MSDDTVGRIVFGPLGIPVLLEAFVAGFSASGEGWNGEWPFEHKPESEMRECLVEAFDKWLATASRSDAKEGFGETGQ